MNATDLSIPPSHYNFQLPSRTSLARTYLAILCLKISDAFFSEQNFAVNIAEAQLSPQLIGPDGSKTSVAASFDHLDFCFTCFFVAELVVNLYANWLATFLRNGYNIVDAAVIILSVLTLAGSTVLPMSVVRTMRAFRAVRLFGKFRRVPSARGPQYRDG